MDLLAIHAQNKSDHPALISGDSVLVWGDYIKRRNSLASALLNEGLKPGETLVQYLHNSIESAIVMAASSELKTTNTPVNHRLMPNEVSYIISNSDAACVVTEPEFVPIFEEIRGECPNVRIWIVTGDPTSCPDWALPFEGLEGSTDPVFLPEDAPEQGLAMIYTSGTTGKPKGARRGGIASPAQAMAWIQGFGLTADDVHLVAGPLYHSAPMAFFSLAQVLGNTSVIMPKFREEEALNLIERHKVTSTFMAPTLVKRILQLGPDVIASHDLSSLKSLIVAGAPCPQKVKEDVMNLIGPVLYEFYGSTELGINTILKPEDSIRKPGSCGQASGVEIKLLDDDGNEVATGEPGELFVKRNPMTFNEYYKNEDATSNAARGDWVTVGDVAYVDADGFYYICDRKIDMIISGGVNIYPAEIEDVLHRHPEVKDVAVFGIPDEEWGESVHAAVQLVDGSDLDEESLIAWSREQMSGYKVPRSISFHADFPRDVAGKLIKRQLRAPFWEGHESHIV